MSTLIPTKTDPTSPAKAVISMTASLLLRRSLVFLAGLLVMTIGIISVIQAGFGVSPWDVLHLGLAWKLGISFGHVQQVVGILILAVAAILTKKWPSFGAIANMVIVGVLSDWILSHGFIPHPTGWIARMSLFIGGILIWGMGSGIYIAAQLGAGPRDWLMLAIHEKTGWAIRWVRTALEVVAVGVGWFLGGPFFWGTIVFSFTIGHATEFGIKQSRKWLAPIVQRRASS